uniref:Uncharacterized protein n=1 Tax=CrAss-like virus sp. ctYsL76 TaxID=2826826 RepID=A0A8S5QLF6_9CAUD|nr:MAG TPA: hypothetical protein [CrAss-like virus sp. ctYsL76]
MSTVNINKINDLIILKNPYSLIYCKIVPNHESPALTSGCCLAIMFNNFKY